MYTEHYSTQFVLLFIVSEINLFTLNSCLAWPIDVASGMGRGP